MNDPRHPDPRRPEPVDPLVPGAVRPDYRDPAADPRVANQTVVRSGGRGGLIAAGVIAALLVIALIAFTGPGTDPGTTATLPEPAPIEETAPGLAPADPVAPAPDAAAPIEEAPATPMDQQAPAADQ